MTDDRIERQVEKVSEVLSFVVTYDPDTLHDLHEWFGNIAELARESSQPEVAAVATAASKVTERMILNTEYELNLFTPPLETQDDALAQTAVTAKIRDELLEELKLTVLTPRFSFFSGGEERRWSKALARLVVSG